MIMLAILLLRTSNKGRRSCVRLELRDSVIAAAAQSMLPSQSRTPIKQHSSLSNRPFTFASVLSAHSP